MDWERHHDEVRDLRLRARNLEESRLDVNILCASCTNGHLYRREGKLHFDVYCHAIEKKVPQDVIECSSYNQKGAMSLEDMKRLATVIDVRPGIDDKSYI